MEGGATDSRIKLPQGSPAINSVFFKLVIMLNVIKLVSDTRNHTTPAPIWVEGIRIHPNCVRLQFAEGD